MKQTRLISAVEATCSVGSGALISWLLTVYLLPWFLDIAMSIGTALNITLVYTAASIVRSYIWRRIFNK